VERKVLEANPESRPPYNVHMGTRLRWLVVVLLLAGAGILLRMTVLAPEPVEVRVAMVDRGTVEETVANTRAGTVRVEILPRLHDSMRVVYDAKVEVMFAEHVLKGVVAGVGGI